MKKVLCAALMILISTSFTLAQDDATYDFVVVRGISTVWGYDGIPEMQLPVFAYNTLDPFLDFNSSGISTRSIGMGGVYYAMANDGYGSFLNPAGMIYTNKSLMSLNVFSSQDKHNQAFKYWTLDFSDFEGFYDPETGFNFDYSASDIDGQHNRINQGGAVAPFTYFDRDWWFGGGFRTVYDLHNEVSTPLFLQDSQALYTQHRGVDALNMAIATSITPNIAMGVNFNIYTRGYEMDYWSPTFYTDAYGDTVSDAGHMRDKSTFTGTNFDFGAIADFDMIRLGMVVGTGFNLTQKILHTRGNVNPFGETGGFIDRFTIKNKFPMTYGGGVAFTPIENVVLGIDVTYKPFSEVRIDVDPEQDRWTDLTDFDPEWEDLFQYRAGAEYVFDAGFAQIPLRAGIQNLPSLIKGDSRFVDYSTSYLDSLNADSIVVADSVIAGDQFNTNLLSVGTGLHFERIWFDFAYQFGSSSYDFAYLVRLSNGEFEANDPIKFEYSRLYFSMGMLF